MAISFNKREKEKLKQQKRLEKQRRKEERKAEGSASFEDMIAYVDENGNITSTPPDMSKRQEIDVEDIAVSTPVKEEVEEEVMQGRVEHFNSDKGYGFIKDLGSTEKYFFHISNAPASIKQGNRVTFELGRGQKGMNAVNIVLVDKGNR
ncbi:MAG: cold shock domain-containing protein [Bacteroides pyogenes]|uniref:cold-shock protein n=1 Tax=Bacteroides pyogenes TaxID=310300 RepID=UPI002A91FAAF|nr:cold shock domain-containing protein [Bacteroides pyogenes]MDY5354084.1 cold shock domain-containing protein [Bacteroides pyogenes]